MATHVTRHSAVSTSLWMGTVVFLANIGTMTVPNLKTAQPYNGNFLELTVVDVTLAN